MRHVRLSLISVLPIDNLVDFLASRILLGSIRRSRLARLLDSHIGEAARRRAALAKSRLNEKSPVTPEPDQKSPVPPLAPKLLVNGTGMVLNLAENVQQENSEVQNQPRFVVRRVRSCDTVTEIPMAPMENERCLSEETPKGAANGGKTGEPFLEAHYHTISAEPRRSRSFLMALGSMQCHF